MRKTVDTSSGGRGRTCAVLLGLLILLAAGEARPQIRAGASYLKVIPGAGQQGLAGSLAGTIDQMFAIYANPGATGWLREWQLAATYTKWLPDIYNASFLYGRMLRTPWSRRSRLALGVSYLGIKEFDSSNGRSPLASGGDLLATLSFGQPLGPGTHGFALGGSVKYLLSQLDNFKTGTLIFDAGLLYRTRRYALSTATGTKTRPGIIFSAGLSVTQIGSALTFDRLSTPLPTTLRAGASVNAGSHDGLQAMLTGEYRNVEDEDDYFAAGFELAWSYLFSFRAGYSFERDNVLRHYALGVSFRFDDFRNLLFRAGRNKALRLNNAKLQRNTFFSAPYRGSVNYYPIGPEPFAFLAPTSGAHLDAPSVRLVWSPSRDPDLFDTVAYWLLVSRKRQPIETALQYIRSQPRVTRFELPDTLEFAVNATALAEPAFDLPDLACGDYYWTVVAYDFDRHYRIIGAPGREISRFDVGLPDLRITIREVSPSSCTVTIRVENIGDCPAYNIDVAAYDSLQGRGARLLAERPAVADRFRSTYADRIAALEPDSAFVFELPLSPDFPDTHRIIARVDAQNLIGERDETNNIAVARVKCDVNYDLSLEKTAQVDGAVVSELMAGKAFHYALTLTNNGPGDADEFVLSDSLPPFIRVDTAAVYAQAGNKWAVLHAPDAADPVLRLQSRTGLPRDSSVTVMLKATVDASVFPPQVETLRDVTFNTDKWHLSAAELTDSAATIASLNRFANRLQAFLHLNANFRFEVGGHTDRAGPIGWNDKLSKLRAESVRAYLVRYLRRVTGRDYAANFISEGYGPCRPVDPRKTSEHVTENRRVEIRLIDPVASPVIAQNTAWLTAEKDTNPANNRAAHKLIIRNRPAKSTGPPAFRFVLSPDDSSTEAFLHTSIDPIAETLKCLLQARIQSRDAQRRRHQLEIFVRVQPPATDAAKAAARRWGEGVKAYLLASDPYFARYASRISARVVPARPPQAGSGALHPPAPGFLLEFYLGGKKIY